MKDSEVKMIPKTLYKIEGADKDYYFLSREECPEGYEVFEVETVKGSELCMAALEPKPDFNFSGAQLSEPIPQVEEAEETCLEGECEPEEACSEEACDAEED